MAYPDKVLGEGEEVVAHLHPHWLTVLRPIVLFLVLVGLASFGAALVPAGEQQTLWRLVVVGAAAVLALVLVAVPLLRWRTTHYVITTRRLLYRTGVLARSGRDIGLSRITDVSYRQSLLDRVLRSGTVSIETAGEGGPTVFSAVPDSEGVQQLLNQLVDEDAERRARVQAGSAEEPWGGPWDERWSGPDDGTTQQYR
ncbi:PH domain-containing protein [Modestobacter sp. SYSU DS0657]